jgi:hypothetical protein
MRKRLATLAIGGAAMAALTAAPASAEVEIVFCDAAIDVEILKLEEVPPLKLSVRVPERTAAEASPALTCG